jgi:predicted enzyme involved in methoxymalonyl-ACP biosynthesis
MEALLMSCRVLGRGIEDAFLHAMAQYALDRGAKQLVARFVQGPRNNMVRDYLRRCAFRDEGSDVWVLAIPPVPELPKHIRPGI